MGSWVDSGRAGLARRGLALAVGVGAAVGVAGAVGVGAPLVAGTVRSAPAETPIASFLYEWGEPGTGTGQFRALRGIAATDRPQSDGRTLIVVADTGRDLVRSYTADLMFVDKWGEPGAGPGQFNQPRGVTVDAEGNLLVVDSHNHRVQKTRLGTATLLERPGRFLSSFGSKGSGEGELDTPTGIAVDAEGRILVVDTENHRIQLFDAAGRFLESWGSKGSGEGQFRRPTHVEVDADGHVWVADTDNHRVQKLDRNGRFLVQVGRIGRGAGRLAEPKGLGVDRDGNLWVVDRRNHRVQKFAADGTPLGSFGRQGGGRGKFNFPEDLTFDSSGRLYVTDGMNGRIQVFQPS